MKNWWIRKTSVGNMIVLQTIKIIMRFLDKGLAYISNMRIVNPVVKNKLVRIVNIHVFTKPQP